MVSMNLEDVGGHLSEAHLASSLSSFWRDRAVVWKVKWLPSPIAVPSFFPLWLGGAVQKLDL